MSFNVVYVENDPKDKKKVRLAIDKHNQKLKYEPISVNIIESPDELGETLNLACDLVIADVYYDDPKTGTRDKIDRLDEIINIVEKFGEAQGRERSIPIIAYTGRGEAALKSCLERKDKLYDIWDKTTASPPYVAWRLSQLALEFSRIRPDALMQRLICEMQNGASWHSHVVDMARRYDAGRTEADQIYGAGQPIQNILHEIECWESCYPFWEAMSKWEPLGRSVSRRTRGHTRHVINVFWLGYYLFHHPVLRKNFEDAWRNLLRLRGGGDAAEIDPIEALSNCWLFAALFHDMASCVEKHLKVFQYTNELLGRFDFLTKPSLGKQNKNKEVYYLLPNLHENANRFWHKFESSIEKACQPLWEKTLAAGKPDHGVLSALQLTDSLNKGPQGIYAREAARAMALHNLIGNVPINHGQLISWEAEPVASLLVFCDQIQTWDRERDELKAENRDKPKTENRDRLKMEIKDEPKRAELIKLEVLEKSGFRHVNIAINYIGPRHLEHVPELFIRVKDALEYILKDKPNRALNKIKSPWPFKVTVQCYLSGRKLSTRMQF